MRFYLPGYDPGDINSLLVPLARVFHTPPNPKATMKKMIEDLPYNMGGRASKPLAPIMLRMVDGSIVLLPGFGQTEAAELQDLAYAQLDKKRQDWRERFGFESRDTFDSRIREHLDWRSRHPQDHPTPMSALEREQRRRQIPLA